MLLLHSKPTAQTAWVLMYTLNRPIVTAKEAFYWILHVAVSLFGEITIIVVYPSSFKSFLLINRRKLDKDLAACSSLSIHQKHSNDVW